MFTCEYEVEANSDQVNIEVAWYQGNSTEEIHKENVQGVKKKATLQNKKNSKPVFQLGKTVSIEIMVA